MLIRHWLTQACTMLTDSDSPKRDAEILLGHILGKPRSWIIAFDDHALSVEQIAKLHALLLRRQAGEPIAYLCGQREFWSLPLAVSPATLIPRPDTEVLVEKALALLPTRSAMVLDLGTGSGAIALAIASERQDCQCVGVDRVADAVTLARRNAETLSLANCQFIQSHWFDELAPTKFDMIVSNPPYIDAADPHLHQGDVSYEPRSALVAEQQGLADLAWIIEQAPSWLTTGGCLIVEHGWQQHHAVQQIFVAAGYHGVETSYDYGGNPRITYGKYVQA